MSKKTVMFVCTANIFRSMSAKYLFTQFLEKKGEKEISVISSGTRTGRWEHPYSYTIDKLESYGVNPSGHRPTQISKELIAKSDLIICMSRHHVDYIKEHFGVESFLFNEIAFDKKEDVEDDNETDKIENGMSLEDFVHYIVGYIHDAMPLLYEGVKKKLN